MGRLIIGALLFGAGLVAGIVTYKHVREDWPTPPEPQPMVKVEPGQTVTVTIAGGSSAGVASK